MHSHPKLLFCSPNMYILTNTIIEECRQTFEVTRVYSRKHRDKLREDLVENVGHKNTKIERVLITLRLD